MKTKFLVGKMAAVVVAISVAGVGSGQAQFILTLEDQAGNTLTIPDNSALDSAPTTTGEILYMGSLPNNSIWTADIDVALTMPVIGGQYQPMLDIDVQQAYSTGPGTLTITATEPGFGPLPTDTGVATLAMGGDDGTDSDSISGSGQVNGVTVVSLGPFTSNPWSGTAYGNASGLSATFSIGEIVVINNSVAGYGREGDIDLSIVPEPASFGLLVLGGLVGLRGLLWRKQS